MSHDKQDDIIRAKRKVEPASKGNPEVAQCLT